MTGIGSGRLVEPCLSITSSPVSVHMAIFVASESDDRCRARDTRIVPLDLRRALLRAHHVIPLVISLAHSPPPQIAPNQRSFRCGVGMLSPLVDIRRKATRLMIAVCNSSAILTGLFPCIAVQVLGVCMMSCTIFTSLGCHAADATSGFPRPSRNRPVRGAICNCPFADSYWH